MRRWVKELGWAEAETLLIANNAEPFYAVRASAGRQMDSARLVETLTQLDVSAEVSPLLPKEFVRLPDGLQVGAEYAVRSGVALWNPPRTIGNQS